jgi:hypothetical protein
VPRVREESGKSGIDSLGPGRMLVQRHARATADRPRAFRFPQPRFQSVIPAIHRRRNAVFQLVAVTALLFVGLLNCVLAFIFPLELEAREGSFWLHVLATRAGISIYDHTQVAFLNMNHGPLDPLVKSAVAGIFPFLSPAMVTRCFVLLLPAGLFLAMWSASGKKLSALLWAAGLYLFLLGLQPPYFLVGRSDPSALFFLALLGWTARLGEGSGSLGKKKWFFGTIASGLFAAATVLTNWRLFPAAGAIVAGCTLERMIFNGGGRHGAKAALAYLGGVLLMAALASAVLFEAVFHGDGTTYYRHFFGFFSMESGWGTKHADSFEVFPSALMLRHWPIHLFALSLFVLGVIYPAAKLPRAVQLKVWLPLFALLWLSFAVGYFLNHGGGGVYYFGPFYLLLAAHLARAIDWGRAEARAPGEVMVAGLVLTLPWLTTIRQAVRFTDSFGSAYAFLAETERRARGAHVLSEDLYFSKRRYEGEVVDMGDVAFTVSATGFFGIDLTQTVDRYAAALRANPPPFILTGGLEGPVLKQLLQTSYRPLIRVPVDPVSYVGTPQTLYQLRTDVAP